jgi:hypothetical protein
MQNSSCGSTPREWLMAPVSISPGLHCVPRMGVSWKLWHPLYYCSRPTCGPIDLKPRSETGCISAGKGLKVWAPSCGWRQALATADVPGSFLMWYWVRWRWHSLPIQINQFTMVVLLSPFRILCSQYSWNENADVLSHARDQWFPTYKLRICSIWAKIVILICAFNRPDHYPQ